MWRRALEQTGTAAVCLALLLSRLVGEGSVVKVLCRPGERVTLPCTHHHDDNTLISQLSVQWRSPGNQLLCHYIKHKAFQNCSAGYDVTDTLGGVTLSIHKVKTEDFGVHVCSVSKRHEFSDYSVELVRMAESSAPRSGWTCTGPSWRLVLLHTFTLFICL